LLAELAQQTALARQTAVAGAARIAPPLQMLQASDVSYRFHHLNMKKASLLERAALEHDAPH
jgi:hypothetical protein